AAALLGAALTAATALRAPAGGPWPVLAALGYALLAGLATAGPPTGPLDWLVPPLLRAGEYAAVLAIAARTGVSGALPAAFGFVAAAAYHHYDTVYRVRGGLPAPSRRLAWAAGGPEGRTLAVAAAAALTHGRGPAFPLALTALAGALTLTVLAESVRFWASPATPRALDESDESGEPA
ncbi:DUF5941 domain-containing protein, partial [Streptomyces sp. B1866]|uniref:DUF5941 domain-containing protein n=1 Tax=Streptomyces sp. B1866 TaxID=3075431 RepID=UPI00288E4230